MLLPRFLSAALVTIALACGFAVPATAQQVMSAQEYFLDANRLARDDLYWAALLRYRQAAEAGLDTPVLHYNTGVTHYLAGQHRRARESLTQALADPSLQTAAHYNLGLNAYALGETEEALRWFRLVRDQDQDRRLQQFAVAAIARIRLGQERPTDYEVLVEEREEKRDIFDLELRSSVAFGSDDNVFRSPDQVYRDFADPAAPVVTPIPQASSYAALRLSALARINSLPFEGFYFGYRLAGRQYIDEGHENADEYQHELSFGSDYYRKEGSKERELHSAFKVSQHHETYFDPDNGLVYSSNGLNVPNRMNYLRYGPQIRLRAGGEKLAFGAEIKGQIWNYQGARDLPEYDHEYVALSLHGQYKFTPTSLFRVTLDGSSRRFNDRLSYDLDGVPRSGNPDLTYNYYRLELSARQRLFDSLWVGFDVARTERVDLYEGYGDYARDEAGVEVHWDPGRRFEFELGGRYYLYDFPNTFAFHNPGAGPKTQEAVDGYALAKFRVTRRLSIFAEARVEQTVSNDIRIQYDRAQYALGIRWDQ